MWYVMLSYVIVICDYCVTNRIWYVGVCNGKWTRKKCPKNHYLHDPFEKSDLEICRKRRLLQFDADIVCTVCTVSMLMFCGSRLDKVVPVVPGSNLLPRSQLGAICVSQKYCGWLVWAVVARPCASSHKTDKSSWWLFEWSSTRSRQSWSMLI